VYAPYFINLNKNTFRLKTLLFFVHLRSQQKRTEQVMSNYQIYSVKFLQVRWAHKSGDVTNFIIVACRISSRLK